jgi:hypothetical protein
VEIIKEHRQYLRVIAKAYADEMFIEMQDPKNHGPKFKWENFPKLVGKTVYSNVFLLFTDEEFKDHYKEYAQRKAEEYTQELIPCT